MGFYEGETFFDNGYSWQIDNWYQLRPFQSPLKKAKEIVSRLRRKGRTIKVTWFEGLG